MEVAQHYRDFVWKNIQGLEVMTVLHVHQLVAQRKVHVPYLVDNVTVNLLFPQMFLCKQQGK